MTSCSKFDANFIAIVCYILTSLDTDAPFEEVYSLLDLLIHHAGRINAIPVVGGNFNAAIGAPQVCGDLTFAGACGNGARNRRGARMIHWILEQGLQLLNRVDSTTVTQAS